MVSVYLGVHLSAYYDIDIHIPGYTIHAYISWGIASKVVCLVACPDTWKK